MLTRSLIARCLILGLVAFGLSAGCGGSQEQPAESPESLTPEPAPEPQLPALPSGHLWRVQVMEIMSPGLGAFLQRVDVHEELIDGQFHGFRVQALLGDPSFWNGVDLRIGDVVTSVNGQPIGHYDQAFHVWQSLGTAPEIVIAYERGGEQRELRYVIHEDDEAADMAKGGAGKAPAPSSSASPAATSSASAPTPAPSSSAGSPKH